MTEVNEPFYYQKIPCVRFSLPDNKWLKEYHRDSDYGHSDIEQNFNIAITQATNENCLWIESGMDDKLVPVLMSYGEYVAIDHINCLHGARYNTSKKSMISLDFRIINVSDYLKNAKSVETSVNTHTDST